MAIHREQIKTSHAEWRKDTQWPCPKGFHIPTIDERSALINAWIDIEVWESWEGDNFRKKMLMPFAGYRNCAGATSTSATAAKEQWESGYYWSCSPSDRSPWTYACNLSFTAATLNTTASNYRAYGFSLRPFKNEPVNPLNGEILQEGWTPIDWNLFFGEVIARNQSLGLLSLTYNEWHDCITIADKNLWATEAYYRDIRDPEATEPTLSQANCGYYFQWWNNYGFAWTWTVSTTTTRVDTSQYWPWSYQDTYYSRSLFWYTTSSSAARDWSLTPNDNLWGGATNKERYKRFSWVESSDMKWPCPDGFHVPLASEWTNALNIITTLEWISQTAAGANKIATDLHLPYAWAISVSSSPPKAGNYRTTWRYRTATATINTDGAYWGNCLAITTRSSPYREVWWWRRAFGYTIRAFKDVPVAPDNTWTTIFDGSSTATWAWIFWNQRSWLISLSLDWETWITIADKNVWATEVWNYTTDTAWYTAYNCWEFFVWWNNCWQPRTVNSTYSPYQSTKIDATGYWPWNYFNQDIVVTIWTSPDSDWSSVQNDNLWGWVSQGTWRERKYFKN